MKHGSGEKKHPLEAILAGGLAGGIEICISYPTEYVKTHLQLHEKSKSTHPPPYAGVWDCIRKTLHDKGPLGFYRGLSPLLYMSIPKVATRFGSYEIAKNALQDENSSLTRTSTVLCGLFAGVSEAILVVTPMETLKVRFIHDYTHHTPQYKGFFHGIGTIVREHGWSGTYKGLTATILKQGSNQMIRFFVFGEYERFIRKGTKRHLTGLENFIGGVLAGAASVFGNTPVDVVKTRMQGLNAHSYSSTLDCVKQIWTKEGPLAFYRGTLPRLGRVCLDVGMVFMLYHKISDFIHQFFEPKKH